MGEHRDVKIVVVSDTHGRAGGMLYAIGQELPFDALMHCGDVEENLFARFGRAREYELHVVAGNCDRSSVGPVSKVAEVGGKRIYMTHGHLQGVKLSLDRLREAAVQNGADICLFGHTHIPCEMREEGVLYVNPGSASMPGDPAWGRTYAVITIGEDGEARCALKRIPGRIPS